MVGLAPPERRTHPRQAVSAGARLAMSPEGRSFPCRCIDLSAGGARLLAPATLPVRVGLSVYLSDAAPSAGAGAAAAGAASGDHPHESLVRAATIVRVDRQTLLTDGAITLAVRFARPAEAP